MRKMQSRANTTDTTWHHEKFKHADKRREKRETRDDQRGSARYTKKELLGNHIYLNLEINKRLSKAIKQGNACMLSHLHKRQRNIELIEKSDDIQLRSEA